MRSQGVPRNAVERVIFQIFMLEAVLNTVSFFIMFLFPRFSLHSLGLSVTSDMEYMTQWFGCMVGILAWIGWFAPVQEHVVQAFLVGDLVWLYAGVALFNSQSHPWTPGAHFSVWVMLPLVVARTIFVVSRFVGGAGKQKK